MTDYTANVARGIALLDEKGPANWRDRINLGTLNMENATQCILGQVFESYWTGRTHLGLGTVTYSEVFGFNLVDHDHYQMRDLQKAWKNALTGNSPVALNVTRMSHGVVSVKHLHSITISTEGGRPLFTVVNPSRLHVRQDGTVTITSRTFETHVIGETLHRRRLSGIDAETGKRVVLSL